MRKRKAQARTPLTSKNIQEFLTGYDAVTLTSAVNSLEGSLGWQLMKSFMLFQAAALAGYSLNLSQKTGTQFEACAAGAKAEVLRDMAEQFVEQLRSKVAGNEGLVQEQVPED